MPRCRFKVFVAAAALAGCTATNPSLPTRQIDRPFTMPADTREVSLGAGLRSERKDGSDTVTKGYPLGIIRTPISEDWTWEWLTAVSHQFHHDDTNTTGLTFGARGIGWSTSDGFFAEPTAVLYYKHKYSPSFALEHHLGGNYAFRVDRPDLDGWEAFCTAGTLFQLDENKSLTPEVELSLERRYISPVPNWYDFTQDNVTRLVVPLGLEFRWRFGLHWETALRYAYRGLGEANGFRAHDAGLELINYW